MSRIDFVARPYRDRAPARTLRAVIISCLFHGVVFGSVIGFGLLYHSRITPLQSGSAPGVPTLSLATMVIVPPPSQPAPALQPPAMPAFSPPMPSLQPQRILPAKFPEEGIPLLAASPAKLVTTKLSKQHDLTQAVPHPIAVASEAPSNSSAAHASSYSPGPDSLPHPPYPTEASDLNEAGVVVMNVQFNADGGVARAEVAHSSGYAVLDSETRSYIRAHWHSSTYAGQTINQPVEYSLQNL
jgi:TonB family protein